MGQNKSCNKVCSFLGEMCDKKNKDTNENKPNKLKKSKKSKKSKKPKKSEKKKNNKTKIENKTKSESEPIMDSKQTNTNTNNNNNTNNNSNNKINIDANNETNNEPNNGINIDTNNPNNDTNNDTNNNTNNNSNNNSNNKNSDNNNDTIIESKSDTKSDIEHKNENIARKLSIQEISDLAQKKPESLCGWLWMKNKVKKKSFKTRVFVCLKFGLLLLNPKEINAPKNEKQVNKWKRKINFKNISDIQNWDPKHNKTNKSFTFIMYVKSSNDGINTSQRLQFETITNNRKERTRWVNGFKEHQKYWNNIPF